MLKKMALSIGIVFLTANAFAGTELLDRGHYLLGVNTGSGASYYSPGDSMGARLGGDFGIFFARGFALAMSLQYSGSFNKDDSYNSIRFLAGPEWDLALNPNTAFFMRGSVGLDTVTGDNGDTDPAFNFRTGPKFFLTPQANLWVGLNADMEMDAGPDGPNDLYGAYGLAVGLEVVL